MTRCRWLAVGGLLLVASGASAQQPVRLDRAELMRLKLTSSEKALEALTLENYEALSGHAQKLALLTLDESWHALQTMEYRRESDEFRRAADALNAAAKSKNLDGAMLAYMQVTMKCVQCHKYLRNAK